MHELFTGDAPALGCPQDAVGWLSLLVLPRKSSDAGKSRGCAVSLPGSNAVWIHRGILALSSG